MNMKVTNYLVNDRRTLIGFQRGETSFFADIPHREVVLALERAGEIDIVRDRRDKSGFCLQAEGGSLVEKVRLQVGDSLMWMKTAGVSEFLGEAYADKIIDELEADKEWCRFIEPGELDEEPQFLVTTYETI